MRYVTAICFLWNNCHNTTLNFSSTSSSGCLKKNLLVSLFVAISITSISPKVNASTETYQFTGILTDIRGAGAGLSFGNTFIATYTHDDTLQTGSLIEAGRMRYAGGKFSISAEGISLISSASSELQVFDNWTNTTGGYNHDDGYFVSSLLYDAIPLNFYLIQFDLWGFSGTTLSSLAMPSQAQVQQLAHVGRIWIRRFEGGETGLAGGNFSAFTPTSTVPEPTPLALVVLSLIAFFLLSQRRAL
ncbi:MAG: hypothetical protein FD134_1794 [Gallionellaceae bacterium]|nr:MAG: hypothetical protein FD134_1794 [Gallionellaceae bacterium]